LVAILFLYGILIGIIVSVPVGAIAVMSVQRTINSGVAAGFVLGLGAAIADLIYSSVAVFGITFVKEFLFTHHVILGVVGSIFLLVLGYRIFFTNSVKEFHAKRAFSKKNLINDFISSLFISLSNPITIIGFGGIFASLGIVHKANTNGLIIALLSGIFTGAIVWWLSLSTIVEIFRRKIKLRNIIMINRITGVFIYILGLLFIVLTIASSNYLFYNIKDLL